MKYTIQENGGAVYAINDVPQAEFGELFPPEELVNRLENHFKDVPGMQFRTAPLVGPDPNGITISEERVVVAFNDLEELRKHVDIYDIHLAILAVSGFGKDRGSSK